MSIHEVNENYNLFIRINYKTGGKNIINKINTHIKNNIKGEKYIIGGGIINKAGGTFVFQVKDLEEIKKISSKTNNFNYSIFAVPKTLN